MQKTQLHGIIKIMDKLAKAKELAKNNPYLQEFLDKTATSKTESYHRKQEKLGSVMEAIAEVYGEEPQPFILMNPETPTKPLHLPPLKNTFKSKTVLEKVTEQKQMIENINLTKKENHPQPHQKDNIEDNAEAIEAIEATISPTLSPSEVIDIDAHTIDADATPTLTQTEEVQKLPRRRGRPRKNREGVSIIDATSRDNEKTSATSNKVIKKVSQASIRGITSVRGEKLSRATPVIYSRENLKNSTTLTLVALYSKEMTPMEIEKALANQEKLKLTHAELVALSLLSNMTSENPKIAEESRKQYWKIQETLEKSKKSSASVTASPSSLLDRKLEEAQEAIFAELPKKAIDNE